MQILNTGQHEEWMEALSAAPGSTTSIIGLPSTASRSAAAEHEATAEAAVPAAQLPYL